MSTLERGSRALVSCLRHNGIRVHLLIEAIILSAEKKPYTLPRF